MTVGTAFRRKLAAALVAAVELAGALMVVAALASPAGAQLFDDRFPFLEERARRRQQSHQPPGSSWFNPFGAPEVRQAPPADNSKAPAPKKQEATPLTSVVVMGDSMADWLAYGLEIAASESPDIGIVRRHRTNSGLIRTEVKSDPRGEHPDWPQAAREILNQEKANFVVFMIGLNDRKAIRERPPARGSAQPAQQQGAAAETKPPAPSAEHKAEQGREDAEQPPGERGGAVAEAAPTGTTVHEFRSEKWVELYIKRIDETIAALKSKNVPVFWVGLPPIRGTKSSSDVSFLNDLYRSRAEKAGITYIDVWDGFVDDSGRYANYGPDFEGQNRRLRSADSVHFTQAGARKLAHYVERELQRAMVSRAAPVALPVEEPVQQAPAARPGAPFARPLAGPVMPLTSNAETDELLGGSATRQTPTDALAGRVLVHGEPAPAPAGRSDDFVWPRRSVAPVGADPVVATTSLPMTPMQGERPAGAAPAQETAAAAPARSRPSGNAREAVARPRSTHQTQHQQQARADQRRYAPQPQPPAFFFPFFRRW
jgi:hypothetical protein